jgi:hypothetical protein
MAHTGPTQTRQPDADQFYLQYHWSEDEAEPRRPALSIIPATKAHAASLAALQAGKIHPYAILFAGTEQACKDQRNTIDQMLRHARRNGNE